MRLTVSEINTIKSSIYDEDDNAEIYLFGSRTDDSKRGGDIDILILSSKINFSDVTKIKRKIFNQIDEQKIDIIIAKDTRESFVKLAYKDGIRL